MLQRLGENMIISFISLGTAPPQFYLYILLKVFDRFHFGFKLAKCDEFQSAFSLPLTPPDTGTVSPDTDAVGNHLNVRYLKQL